MQGGSARTTRLSAWRLSGRHPGVAFFRVILPQEFFRKCLRQEGNNAAIEAFPGHTFAAPAAQVVYRGMQLGGSARKGAALDSWRTIQHVFHTRMYGWLDSLCEKMLSILLMQGKDKIREFSGGDFKKEHYVVPRRRFICLIYVGKTPAAASACLAEDLRNSR